MKPLRWLLWLAVAALVATTLAIALQHWLGIARVRGEIAKEHIALRAGHAYATALWVGRPRVARYVTTDSDPMAPWSRLELFEDGKPLGPPNVHHTKIEQEGGGRYSHWNNALLVFSASDGSDPRANGRRYTYVAPIAVPARGFALAWACAAAAGLLIAFDRRRPLLAAWRRGGPATLSRFADALVVPSVIAILVVLTSPYQWNHTDSLVIFSNDVRTVPHYPPLYPELIALVKKLFGHTPLALKVLVGVQHALSVLAVAYFASAFATRAGRIAASALATVGLCMFLYSHGIFTESLAHVAILACAGAALRLLDRESPPLFNSVVFLVALALGTLARHPTIVVGIMLPASLVGCALLARAPLWPAVRSAGIASLAIIAVYVGATAFQTTYCLRGADWCGSLAGRTGVYRIQETAIRLPPEERKAWIERLVASADDPLLGLALRIMVEDRDPWLGTRKALAAEPRLAGRDADDWLNRGFGVYLRHWGTPELSELVKNIDGYCCSGMDAMPWRSALNTTNWIRAVYERDADAAKILRGLGVDGSAPTDFGVHAWFVPLGDAPSGMLIAAILVLGFVRRNARSGMAAAVMLSAYATYVVGCSIATIYLPRYGLSSTLLAWAALACILFTPGRHPGAAASPLRRS